MWPRPSIFHLPSSIFHLPCGFARDPTDFIHCELFAGVVEEAVRVRHEKRVGGEIFFLESALVRRSFSNVELNVELTENVTEIA